MRAALTGGSGFVGSHLVERLVGEGHEVVGLARSDASARTLEQLGARVVRGDLEDEPALASLVAKADVVFHLAGLIAARSEAEYLRVNRDGAARVAAALARAGRGLLVHVSSLAVSGPSARGRPLEEAGAPRPVSLYGQSKAAGEQAVRASDVPSVCVRPPAVYGPRDRELLRVFQLARRGLAPLLGDGLQELSLVHAADLAEALVAVARQPAALGQAYHVAGPERVTQRELLALVGDAVGRRALALALPAPLVRGVLQVSGAWARLQGRASLLSPDKAPELLAPAWTCTSAALERDTGWHPRFTLRDGLRQTAEAYRAAGWL